MPAIVLAFFFLLTKCCKPQFSAAARFHCSVCRFGWVGECDCSGTTLLRSDLLDESWSSETNNLRSLGDCDTSLAITIYRHLFDDEQCAAE